MELNASDERCVSMASTQASLKRNRKTEGLTLSVTRSSSSHKRRLRSPQGGIRSSYWTRQIGAL